MRARSALRFGIRAAALAAAAAVLAPVIGDAVLVAPHAIFMNHRTRTGQMYLINTGTLPEEVSVDLEYGYPASDSEGGVYVRIVDHPDSSQPSASSWIRAYPRRTVVAPGERQLVRLLAEPPLGLPDGEYWSRVIVTSEQVRPALATDTSVRAGVNVQIRTILSLQYRKGPVTTSVAMTEFRPELTRDSLIAWVELERGGNAAYLGSVALDVRDPQGRALGNWTTPIAVYYHVRRRFAFALDSAATLSGPYAVRVRVSTDREDLAASDVLPAPPVVDSAVVQLH